MELIEQTTYDIRIQEDHIPTLVNLMIQIEIGLKSSGLSNNINIDMETKSNKELLRQLVSSFNDILFEHPNIDNDGEPGYY